MCTTLGSTVTTRKKQQPRSVWINLVINHINRVWPTLLITSFKIIKNEKRKHLNLRSHLVRISWGSSSYRIQSILLHKTWVVHIKKTGIYSHAMFLPVYCATLGISNLFQMLFACWYCDTQPVPKALSPFFHCYRVRAGFSGESACCVSMRFWVCLQRPCRKPAKETLACTASSGRGRRERRARAGALLASFFSGCIGELLGQWEAWFQKIRWRAIEKIFNVNVCPLHTCTDEQNTHIHI